QELVERLGTGVAPAAFRRSAKHQGAILAEGDLRTQAIDFGSRGEQHLLALPSGLGEHDFGSVNIGLDGSDRAFDDQLDTDGGGQMADHVTAVYQLREHRLVVDAVDDQAESRVVLEVLDVVDFPGGEVVDDLDGVAPRQASVGEMRADEPGT